MQSSLFSMVVCFILCVECSTASRAEDRNEASKTLVVVISGFQSDPSEEQIAGTSLRGRGNSGMYQLAGDLAKAGLDTQFFNWNGTEAGKFKPKDPPGTDGIVSFIRERSAKTQFKQLVVVGHSWGGHTMLEVAAELESDPKISIALAIGVDPSSLSRGARPKKLSSAIKSLVVYHTRNAFVWGAVSGGERVHNIDLGDPENGFMDSNRANYASKLDLNAHNAAEWDERIHADISKRIKAIVDEVDLPSLTDKTK